MGPCKQQHSVSSPPLQACSGSPSPGSPAHGSQCHSSCRPTSLPHGQRRRTSRRTFAPLFKVMGPGTLAGSQPEQATTTPLANRAVPREPRSSRQQAACPPGQSAGRPVAQPLASVSTEGSARGQQSCGQGMELRPGSVEGRLPQLQGRTVSPVSPLQGKGTQWFISRVRSLSHGHRLNSVPHWCERRQASVWRGRGF